MADQSTGTQRLSRAEKQAETRERLLHAAMTIAAEEGFAALTVSGVAAAAGLTKGAVYSNFDSKEDLVLEVADRLTPGLNLTDELLAADDVAGMIDRLAAALAQMVRTHSKELVLAFEFEAYSLRDEKVREAIVRQQGTDPRFGDDPVTAWLEQHAGDLPVSAEHFMEAINAVAWGLAFRRLVYGPSVMPDEVMRWTLERLAPPRY